MKDAGSAGRALVMMEVEYCLYIQYFIARI